MTQLTFLVLCTDGALNAPPQRLSELQQNLMRNFFKNQHGVHIAPLNTLLVPHDAQDPNDICAWHGFMCTDGAVTTLVSNKSVLRGNKVDLRWLPSTLKFGNFHNIDTFFPWDAADLPRSLKYLFVSYPYEGNPHAFDTRRLPSNLQELFLSYVVQSGSIHLSNLPRPLRLLYIRTMHAPTLFLDDTKLPQSLKFVSIEYDAKKRSRGGKIITVSGEPADERVIMGDSFLRFVRASWYHDRIELIADELSDVARNAWQ